MLASWFREREMATLVIRNVDAAVHTRLKARAAAHGRSMEEEARVILRQSLVTAPVDAAQTLGQAMRAIFEPLGGLDLPPIPPAPSREPPDFSGPEWAPPG
jgi:plasmid stability protein